MKRPAVFSNIKQGSSSCGVTATSNKPRTVQNSVDLSPLITSRLRDKTPDVSSNEIGFGRSRSAKVHADFNCPEKEGKEEKDYDVEIGRRVRETSFSSRIGGRGEGASQRISCSPMVPYYESSHSKPDEDNTLPPSPLDHPNVHTSEN